MSIVSLCVISHSRESRNTTAAVALVLIMEVSLKWIYHEL